MPEIHLFREKYFGGYCQIIRENCEEVDDELNDQIRSAHVYFEIWDLPEHREFHGRQWRLVPGEYEDLSLLGIPAGTSPFGVSSVRLVGR